MLEEAWTQEPTALNTLNIDSYQPVEPFWNEITTQIYEVGTNVLGKMKPWRRFLDKATWWWTEEVQAEIKAKKITYKAWFQTRLATDLQQYTVCWIIRQVSIRTISSFVCIFSNFKLY